MIASLTGILKAKLPTEVLVDVNGVGYSISIPFSTFEKLGEPYATVTLLTHLQVREDALQLYGFLTEDERYFFRLLISVSGIGPKIAQGILSGISVKELRDHIVGGNAGALTAIPGIGKKTAERLILELREKVSRTDGSSGIAPRPSDDQRTQALMALTSLGYSKSISEKALQRVFSESPPTNLSLEEIIKRALRHTTSPYAARR